MKEAVSVFTMAVCFGVFVGLAASSPQWGLAAWLFILALDVIAMNRMRP